MKPLCVHAGYGDGPAGGQEQVAAVGVEGAAVDDIGRDKKDVAVLAGGDEPLVHDVAGRIAAGELKPTTEKILVGQVEGGCRESCRVDDRIGTEHHAVGVDEKHVTVGQELPHDSRRIAAHHAIEHRTGL